MYRALCFLVILGLANGFCWRTHSRHHHRHFWDNDLFDDIAERMNEVNKILKSACSSDRTTEAYETEKFVINHHLPEYKEDYIDVVIKERVIETTAKKSVGDINKFRDLRILPSNLDISRASWSFVDGNVIIILPFIEEKKEFCGKDGGEMKIVPKAKEEIFNIDVRFGKDVIS